MQHRLISVLCLLLVIVPAMAIDLNQAQVMVNNTSATERQIAFSQGLADVLIKQSGDSFIVSNPLVKQQLPQARNYLALYRYQRRAKAPGPEQALYLNMQFSEQAIQQLLIKVKHPLWGLPRPLSILWIAEQTTSGRSIEYADNDDLLMQALQQASRRRGLPVIFPLGDLQSISAADVDDLWQFNMPALLRASQRYNTDNMLVARIDINHQGVWQAQWLAQANGHRVRWQTSAAELQQAVDQGIDNYANAMANLAFSQQQVNSGQHTTLTQQILVEQIKDLQQYNAVKRYLQHIKLIQQVNTIAVETNYVVFNLEVNGDQQDLLSALAVDGRLHYKKSVNSDNARMVFNWQQQGANDDK